ncbi:host cell division inhibitor Icd-like protein [Salmonella enterica subsp. enterica serovar Reading]|nr:host cell division inhibitor Icd-like protein [Salmonella enterica subsp. enterica serovar Reading]
MCNAMTVTKRKSAPLPERLCERITYSTAMFAIWVNFSDKFVQCEGVDHRYHSTSEMQNILLQNAVGHAVRKAKNSAGGATGAVFSGCPVVINYSCSLALRRWRRLISPCIDAMMNCDVLSPDSFTDSMAFTISCGTRAFRACDFAFVVPVAISIPLLDWWGTVYTEKAQIKLLTWATPKAYSGPHLEIIKVHKCKAPQVSLPLAGLLTTNDSNSIEVAMRNYTTHPQGRDSHNLNKYIWRFIALSTAQPRVIHIEATSEQEARQQSPDGCVMVFAARIRQEVHHA